MFLSTAATATTTITTTAKTSRTTTTAANQFSSSSFRHVKMQRITRAFSVFFLSILVVTSRADAAASSCSTNAILISTGLRNLGNTCYLNAQLQCAYHIPKVRHLVLHGNNNNNNNEKTLGSPALQALRILFQDMTAVAAAVTTKSSSTASTVLSLSSSSNKRAAPVVLCQTLGIPLYQQQDSQEFWKLFLPALQYPPLTDLYQGSYQDTIIALDGSNRQKRREEVFLDLSLDLLQHDHDNNNNNKVHNLQSSLQQFVKAEILSVAQGNGWRPPPLSQPHQPATTTAAASVADKIDAKKGIQLYPQGLPSILQLHLKRFHFDWNTETTSKLNVPFEFTPELDLCCRRQDNNDNDNNNKEEEDVVVYDLQAVIVHMGEYDSGHYYAYVRPDMRSDEWYRFNDEIVTRVTLKEVLEDSIGGLAGTSGGDDDESSLTSSYESGKVKKKGFFAKLLEAFLGESSSSSSGHYGFGGPTSNAYVLQYVRRRDIPALYDPEDVE